MKFTSFENPDTLRACRRPRIFSPAIYAPQLSFETLFCRPYLIEIPGTQRHPRDPIPTPPAGIPQRDPRGQGNPKGPKGTQGDPWGSKGTQADPRAPSAPLGGMGPWGPLGVIPKPFRVESHPEWKAILNGRPFRKERIPLPIWAGWLNGWIAGELEGSLAGWHAGWIVCWSL